MKLLSLDDILDIDAYETVRADYRARVLEHKQPRRVAVGDRVTLVFEDRETLRYQIQEMTRVEQARGDTRIQGELDAYNELVPGTGELSATLFIEITEMERIRPELDRLVGIDEHVALVLGEDAESDEVRATFDPNQMEEERISAVQYVRFALTPDRIERVARGDRLRLRIDHPEYTAEAELTSRTRASLLRDLRDDPAVLLDPGSVRRAAAAGDEVLAEGDGYRILRPVRREASEHRIVELSAPAAALQDIDPERWSALLPVLRELIAEVSAGSGGCRIWADPDPSSPLRIHVSGRPATSPR